ncbi:MAG: tRNA pseudouridine(13) synthase TruD [Candidatus Woesearchaeota archaeon]|jgi:tRNA pseudouridine13 synthase|nr:tRNA pseudouridine(13) synthase TruD [Candidatus Woesearchaeota archaeon]
MKLKQIPQDFIVDEIFDLDIFKDRDEERKQPYYYFKLTKTNYNQMNALQKIARTFNTSKKLVHFSGIKDKVGVTSQLVSVYGINEENYQTNLDFFNNQEDLKLEFIDKFKSRINLGDNLGNRFSITVRDLEDEDLERAKKNLISLQKDGVLNYFDEQRFGYANNSHIVGRYVLQNNLQSAVKEILTSLPNKTQSELMINFVKTVKENWEGIVSQDLEMIDKVLEATPRYLENEQKILQHLKKHKNDFPGGFKRIHKKIRTLYINAYQSYIFNETILKLKEENLLENYKELSLIDFNSNETLDAKILEIVSKMIQEDNLTFENFKLPSMPELKLTDVKRDIRIFPKDLTIQETSDDDLNENKKKVIITFDLGSGQYATNVVKQLFL